jgi:hypothetical protein
MSDLRFDPAQIREELLGATGYQWALDSSFLKAKADGGLGGSAESFAGLAIECLLVGFDEPAERLLSMAEEWVLAAIEGNERTDRYFPDADEAARFETLAFCRWLRSNRHDTESLAQFVQYKDRYLNGQKRPDKIGVSLTVVTYVDAGAFERTLEIFDTTRGLSPPTGLVARNEAQMAYLLSRHHLGLDYSADDLQTAARKFLMRNINTWLARGHWVRAAEWLKVLHWNSGDRSVPAKEIVLKSYDYIRGVSFPQ